MLLKTTKEADSLGRLGEWGVWVIPVVLRGEGADTMGAALVAKGLEHVMGFLEASAFGRDGLSFGVSLEGDGVHGFFVSRGKSWMVEDGEPGLDVLGPSSEVLGHDGCFDALPSLFFEKLICLALSKI